MTLFSPYSENPTNHGLYLKFRELCLSVPAWIPRSRQAGIHVFQAEISFSNSLISLSTIFQSGSVLFYIFKFRLILLTCFLRIQSGRSHSPCYESLREDGTIACFNRSTSFSSSRILLVRAGNLGNKATERNQVLLSNAGEPDTTAFAGTSCEVPL